MMKKLFLLMLAVFVFMPVPAMSEDGFSFMGIKMGEPFAEQFPVCGYNSLPCYDAKYPDIDKRSNIYPLYNLPDIGIKLEPTVSLIDGNIEFVHISMDDSGADRLLNLLKKKYGEPKLYRPGTAANRMGAKWQTFEAMWKIKGCTISLTARTSRIDEGLLIIYTEKYIRPIVEESRKKDKDALDNL